MNVGSFDRMLRIILGLVVLAVGLSPIAMGKPLLLELSNTWQWVAVVVGAVLLLTGLFRFCPAYTILGMNTCRR